MQQNQNIFNSSYSKRIRTYMKSCSEDISETNLSMQYQILICMSVLYVVLIAAALLILRNFRIHPVYYTLLPVFIIFGALNYYLKNSSKINSKLIKLECISFYVLFFICIILTDIIPYKTTKASLFPIVIVSFSALYIDYYPIYIILELALFTFYCICDITWKIPEIAMSDIFDGFAGMVVSLVTAYIVLGIRAKQGKLTSELKEKTSTDFLTGLLNKATCEQMVSEYINRKSDDNTCALIVIDIDNFKSVNDKLGHEVGDAFLTHVGRILTHTFRTNDIIGRVGGDEFMILVRRIPANETILNKRCEQILKSISDYKSDKGWNFSCSIGVVIDKGIHSYEELNRMADDCLYLAKAKGKDCYVKWSASGNKYDKSLKLLLISSNNEKETDAMVNMFKYDYDDIIVSDNAIETVNILSQYKDNIKSMILTLEKTETDNIDILKYVKQRPALADVNTVVVTNDNAINLEAVKIGAIGAFSKPYREENLKKLIG
ncbi:MAG: GGDEF domain-containing protein [Butyrivibrio sp.]|nr:GGDEF domain-containing protein [Butyrivibrio sp.]